MSFVHVDLAPQPEALVSYLRWADGFAPIRAYKRQALDRLEALTSLWGATVLDVGCGRGVNVDELRHRVGPKGRVLGVDRSERMLEEARRLHPAARFLQGDAEAVPLPDESVDVVRADRLLVHLDDPEPALQEFLRVLRPGGHLLLLEGELSATRIEHPQPRSTAAVVRHLARAERHPQVGAQLPGLVRAAGARLLRVGRHELHFDRLVEANRFLHLEDALRLAVASGELAPDAAVIWWLGLLRQPATNVTLPGVGLVARKP